MPERLLPLLLVLLLQVAGIADARAQAQHDAQVWTAVLGNAKLGEDDSGPALWLDVHLRRSGANLVHIARPGVGWRAAPWVSAWAGYGFVPVLPDGADPVVEHRLWQPPLPPTSLLHCRPRSPWPWRSFCQCQRQWGR